MNIRRMRANFGCLNKAELGLHEGLNIIEAPNESGKSTWCAFLRAMLYGIDSSRRGALPDRQRYAPWSGAPMEGQLQLCHQGKEITLYRRSLQPGAPMRNFAALYTGSGEAVSELSAADVGEQLTGLTESVFERSAFIRQGAMAVDNSAELEKRLSSLLTAGEEGTSFAEAEQRLRAWQRSRRSRGRGHLPMLEHELEGLKSELKRMEALEGELSVLEENAERAGNAWKKSLEAAETRMTRQRQSLYAAKQDIAMLEEEALRAERACGTEPRPAPGVRPGLWWLWSLLLFAGTALLCFERMEGLIPLALGALGILWDIVRIRRGRTAVFRAAEQRERWEQRCAQAAARRREAENAAADLRKREEVLLAPDPEAEAACRDAERVYRTAREACAAKGGELRALGDRLVLESRILTLEAERQREEERYQALDIALEELRGAYEELQSRFSPLLAQKTAALFERLTGGRYSEVLLQRSLTALVQRSGDSVPHESACLSRGTAEQMYLAMRLALCELLDSEGNCPLILDDALVSFDEERLGLALEVLSEVAGKRQVILFTCQQREKLCLATLRARAEKGESPEQG